MAKSINRLLAELVEDDGDVKTEALDNAQPVITLDSSDVAGIASQSVVSLTTYQTLDSLPITGLTGGDQAYVRANNRLYISNGSGWYNVSLINLSPRFDSDINSTFSIVDSQTPLVITNPASDSDNPDAIITYGGTMSDSGQYLVALTRDSSVWTFTPLSADSVYDNVTLGNLTDSNGGSFTYSFTASDNINQAVKSITITYDGLKEVATLVDSSGATVLLMKARNTGSQPNAIITYQNASDGTVTLSQTGTDKAEASKFSPYRSGGYSYYFDGSTGYLQFDNSDESLVPETGDFTLEFWFNTWQTSREDPFSVYTSSAGFAVALNYPAAGGIMIYSGNNIQQQTAAGGHFETNVWNHFAMERSGNTQTIYINGQSVVSGTVTRDYSATTALHIGNAANNSLYFYGWLSDLRFVKGSTVYGGNFTPPTERLTAIANTQLLTCNLPYFGDASTNNRTATMSGTAATEALGPYDYFEDSDGVVGSVHIDQGEGQLSVTDYANVFNFGNGDWTVEGWYRLEREDQATNMLWSTRGSSTYREMLMLDNEVLRYYGSTTGSGWTTNYSTGYTFPKDVWHHIAAVRNGGNIYVFINGKRYTAKTGLTTTSLAAATGGFIGADWRADNEFNGSVSDFRVVLGTAVYTADFVVPTQPLEHISGTTLLMQNKTNANAYDAANANAIKGEHGSGSSGPNTTYRQFTTSPSFKFNGSSDHYIVPKSRLFDFNTGDFTVEAWLYTSSVTTTQSWCGTYYGNGAGGWNCQLRYQSGTWYLAFGTNGDAGAITNTLGSAMPVNTWVHIAITRDSTGIRMWADGTELGTATANSTVLSYYSDLYIGKLNHSTAHQYFNGYIQDLRISKGLARYTSNFTPPTTEFRL